MTPTRILLIDDHAMFRTGLRLVLTSGMQDVEIAEACSLEAVMHTPVGFADLVLLDIKLPGLNGLEGITMLKRKWPQALILMLSSQDEPETRSLALARGAVGFISKSETADSIINALHLVLRSNFIGLVPEANSAAQRCLTPRQCEVLNLLNQGLSNKLIARQLALSDNTVRRHVQDILEFFQVANRSEAVFAARRLGLIG